MGRFFVRLSAGVTALLLALPGLASPAAASESAGEATSVQWVVGSGDTFADAVDRALASEEPQDVVAALRSFETAAAAGASVNFPGLDRLTAEKVEDIAGAAAAAVTAGADLPAEARTLTADTESGKVVFTREDRLQRNGGWVTPLGVISQGYAYEQTNWIRRGVTNGSGGVNWTDRIQLRWVTNPGALSSRIDYWMTYPLNQTGFFGASRATTWAWNGATNVKIGTGNEILLGTGSFGSRTVSNSPTMYSKAIWHSTRLSNIGVDGVTYADTQRTPNAKCRPSPDRSCTY